MKAIGFLRRVVAPSFGALKRTTNRTSRLSGNELNYAPHRVLTVGDSISSEKPQNGEALDVQSDNIPSPVICNDIRGGKLFTSQKKFEKLLELDFRLQTFEILNGGSIKEYQFGDKSLLLYDRGSYFTELMKEVDAANIVINNGTSKETDVNKSQIKCDCFESKCLQDIFNKAVIDRDAISHEKLLSMSSPSAGADRRAA